ncbi:zinc finger protein Xfin [Patella vulgata]|uniref:zinc finger protein Xfin n=1 Tax=Patella vulgata TaxID=6465 RepID=UPI0024AA0108|nr:zinc finger protein Xfin [Patella vulgata]XP_050395583.2 zinc finger protein Xfin [Patella vulgata]XP_050395584.2 zinc finger protein Xfin [Patella vulgata]
MSGNSPKGSSDVQLDSSSESQIKGRGRIRRCKHCKFSCTDAKEFFHHQMMEHEEENDQSFASPNKGLPKLTPIRTRNSQSLVEETPEEIVEKTNGDTIIINSMVTDDEEADEDGRLIIADQQEEGSNSESAVVTPTRCGNIQNRTYVCSGCDFSSTSAKVFLNHQKDAHNFDIIIYECDICDYATKYKQKLPRHRKLHFSGQGLLIGEGLAGEMDEFNGFSNDDTFDNLPEEDELPEDSFKDLPPLIDSNTVVVTPTDPDDVIPEVKKTKKRQEVDPAKYFEVVDDTGCKYACSSCGNVYKWRKSLNKHWKEKHGGEMPDNSRKPPGLVYLVNSGGHTICGRRKILANSVLNRSQNGSMSETPHSSAPGTPLTSVADMMNSLSERSTTSTSPVSTVIPSFIGPFVTHSVQPVFPETSTPNAERRQQLLKPKYSNFRLQGQHEPLDFSVRKDDEEIMQSSYIKSEPRWESEDPNADDKDKSILQCTKCSFIAKTLVDYSSHMTLHLNKRAFKCAECQEHFNGVDDLNLHFADVHANRIQEHKEAIQRIPHGLQQTYHLLKMPLNAITSLSSQDLTTADNKKLKCNMCSFVAKWPAELQKHAVSHSEERPFMCMVCGSTYKWKWDLVKHFEKSHHTLPNPYKRREMSAKNGSSPYSMTKSNMSMDDEALLFKSSLEDPPSKKRRLSDSGMDAFERMDEDENRNSLSHLTDLNIDVNGLASIGRNLGLASNRPSSLPRLSDMEMEDEDSIHRLQISNIHSLQEREALLGKRPINETTQKAIHAAVLNRLNNGGQKEQQITQLTDDSSVLLPYKCQRCEYRARWPSEITQHMKNHSEDKPYLCPRCSYRSKWKWDVVKHLKRCGGGGTIKDVIDTTKVRRNAPPNVTVMPEGRLQQQTPQPNNYTTNYQRISENSDNLLGGSALASIARMTMEKQDMEKQPRTSSSGGKKPVFRSLINDGLYYCLECQFVGTSPAELKRHAVLHSENKPFMCDICDYSSRWKCDLKKHRKTYNHYTSAAQMLESQASDHNQNSDTEDSENSFRCQKCYFSTDQPNLFKAHLEVHDESKSPTPCRFKCKQCSFQVNDLASFVQHRVTHTDIVISRQSSPAQSQNSPAASHTSESPKTDMDEARIKHPRKQVKTFHCIKCDFVCKRRDLLESHELEHDDQESMLKCVYCDASFKDKDSLLDHISNHSDFNPDEWETFFMEEELEENNNEQMESLQQIKKPEGSNASDTPRLASALAAGPLNKTEVNNQPQRLSGGIIVPAVRKFTCEWCDATFAHVTTLYHHGKNVHPIELGTQEMAESARDFLVSNTNRASHIDSKQQQLQQHLQQQQAASQYSNALFGGNQYLINPSLITSRVLSQVPSVNKERPILPNNLDPMKGRRMISPQKKAKSFQCTKCPFTAPNAVTYLRHIERHGSNCKHTCWFCDYSIDRLNLLYQHMKGTHTDQWRKTATTGDVSPKSDRDNRESVEPNHDNSTLDMSPKGSRLLIKEEIMLKGVPVQICTYDGKRVFKCKKCSFISSNAATTTNHAGEHAPSQMNKDKMEKVQSMNNLVKALRAQKEKKKTYPSNETQCSKCPFKATSPDGLLKHATYHNYDGMYRCKQCDYSTDKVMMLTQHMQLHENNQPTKQENIKSFVPLTSTYNRIVLNRKPSTGKDTSSKLLSIHAKTSLNKSRRVRYKCSRCPYNTFCKNNMVKHRKQHIIKSRFRCPICNYSATRDYLLFQHMKFHGGDADQMIKKMKESNFEDVVLDPFDSSSSPSSNHRMDEDNYDEEMDKSAEDDVMTSQSKDGQVSYKCKKCPFLSDSSSDYQQHAKQHFIEQRYKCDYCSFSDDRLQNLLQHRNLHSNEEYFNSNPPLSNVLNKSYTDGVTSTSSNQNKDTTDTTRDEMRYSCLLCPYKCNSVKSFSVHTSMHGVNKKFICDFCNWSVDRLNLLYQHRRVHSNEPGFENNPEEIVFMNREFALGVPMANKLREPLGGIDMIGMEKDDLVYSCTDCPFTTANKNSFTNHKALHESPARHKCSECSYSVDKWSLMCQHKKLHDGDDSSVSPTKKRLRCPKCPYHSQNRQLLDNHMKMHASGHKYNCGICDYSIDQLNLLQQHVKVHNETKPSPHSSNVQLLEPGTSKITCPQLYFTSATDDSVLSDASEEEFKCDRCPFSTPSKQQFDDHENRHNFKNRVSCPYCDFSSTTDNQILEHIQVHFPGTPTDALKLMLERRQKEPNNNTDADDKMAQKIIKKAVKVESEPDSTVSESQKIQQPEEDKSEKPDMSTIDTEDSDNLKQTTKVYVCQYCEREFNKKSNMIQHERQHLIGHQY